MEYDKHCADCSICSNEHREQTDTVLKDVVGRTGSTKEVASDILNMHVTTIYENVINLKEREDVYGRIFKVRK